MKKTLLSLACTALMTGVTSTAMAGDWSLTGNVALTTDYVFRGMTQTDGTAAVQGGADLTHASGFFAGVWASNVESSANHSDVNYLGAGHEVDAYLGWSGAITNGGPTLTLKALQYMYPGQDTGASYDTSEYSAYLAKDFGSFSLKGGVNYSDDYFAAGDAMYWDLGASIPVSVVSVNLHYGATDYDRSTGDDYEDYKIGVSGTAAGFGLDLSWTGTSGDVTYPGSNGDRVAFTVSKTF